jgi:Uma2 family endonuclease
MNAVPSPNRMTAEQYLAWESAQQGRNEFVDGEVFAMTGVRISHNLISMNIAMALRQALRGQPCLTLAIDLKLHVAEANAYFYPDVLVTCHPSDLADGKALAVNHPWLIVEVLSDSTAAYDRGQKFESYRQIEALTHYLLIEQSHPHADLFVKNAEGLWVLHPFGAQDTLVIAGTHHFELPVAALYEGVAFEAPKPAAPPP